MLLQVSVRRIIAFVNSDVIFRPQPLLKSHSGAIAWVPCTDWQYSLLNGSHANCGMLLAYSRLKCHGQLVAG